MQVKRFHAPTMKEALEAVKQELGDEAVILKTGVLPRSGVFDLLKKDVVEVIAAVDVPDSKITDWMPKKPSSATNGYFAQQFLQQSGQGGHAGTERKPVHQPAFPQILKNNIGEAPAMPRPDSRANSPRKKTARPNKTKGSSAGAKRKTAPSSLPKSRNSTAPNRPASAKKTSTAQRPVSRASNESITGLKAEVRELRAIVKSMNHHIQNPQKNAMLEFADMPTTVAQEMMGLLESGIERPVARQLVESALTSLPPEDLNHSEVIKARLTQEMAKLIQTSGPISCKKNKSKVIALVGPTGVGKTTTLAKLAANSKFVFNKKVSLISADTYRMAAIEHLNTFAGIAHLPISAVYSPDELRSALAAHQDKDLVFIDTAGRSPRDEKHLQELKKFMKMAQPDEIHLVLPANFKSADLIDTIQRFSILPIDHIVVSKVDETSQLGGLVNIAAESKNPISYITNGQMIPDDIELANPQQLAKMIMKAA